jgi:glutathione S-transferase
MQLYLSLTSPYARKVRVFLLEKDLAFEAIDVAALGRPGAERPATERSITEHNPLGKVPTLILDDGTALFDSTVIVEALDGLYPLPKLIPDDPRERALVRRWEALADGISDVLVPMVLERRRPVERQDTAYASRLEHKARQALELLNGAVRDRGYLHGDAFGLADIAAVCAVGYANLRAPEVLSGLGELADYSARLLTRPSLSRTVPPNLPIRG